MWSVTWSGHVMSRARKTHLTRSPSDLFDHKTGFFELLSSTQAYNHNLILSFNVFSVNFERPYDAVLTFIWKKTWNFIFHLWTARFRRRDNLGMVYVTDRNVIVYLKVSRLCHICHCHIPISTLEHTLMTKHYNFVAVKDGFVQSSIEHMFVLEFGKNSRTSRISYHRVQTSDYSRTVRFWLKKW